MNGSDFNLSGAIGWLELGDWQEAYDELENLPPQLRAHSEALKLYCRVWAMAGRWKELAMIAGGAALKNPDEPEFCWQFAWAQYKLGRPEAWTAALLMQSPRFPNNAEYAYRLACLLAVSNRISEAGEWLKTAVEQSNDPGNLKRRALEQPELERLWTEVQNQKSLE